MRARTDQPMLTSKRRLGRFTLWLLPGLLAGCAAVLATGNRVQLLPPSVESDSAEYAAATTQIFVDFPRDSALLSTRYPVEPLADRAHVYARLATSPAIRELIGEQAGIDPAAIDIAGPYNPEGERTLREPTAERRSLQLQAEEQNYRLRFDTEPNEAVPMVLIYAQAPTVPVAERLADAGASGLMRYIDAVQRADGVKDAQRLRLEQVGDAIGGTVNPGVDRQIALLVFVATLLAWLVLSALASHLLGLARARGSAVPPAASQLQSGRIREKMDGHLAGSRR